MSGYISVKFLALTHITILGKNLINTQSDPLPPALCTGICRCVPLGKKKGLTSVFLKFLTGHKIQKRKKFMTAKTLEKDDSKLVKKNKRIIWIIDYSFSSTVTWPNVIKSDKIKEIYTTITKTKLLKIWFWDNILNVPHKIILEVKIWNMNSANCSIIKELKTKKYQIQAHDARACELTSYNTKKWLDNLNITLRSHQLTVDENELPIP